jgi:hypothetical protein
MSIKKKMLAVAGATALAAGLTLAVAAPAQAINRMGCASHVLNLVSGSTTCWGNAGYTTVTLYGVYGISAGDNVGYIQGFPGTTYFARWGGYSIPWQTVAAIEIY